MSKLQLKADMAETEQCPDCDGTGEAESSEEKTVECPTCEGTGKATHPK